MKELRDMLGLVVEGLKSFAEGMGVVAGKVDALAQSLGDAAPKPSAPKKKEAKAEPKKVKKVPAKKPVIRAAVKPPVKKTRLKAAPVPEKKAPVTASDAVLEIISNAGNGVGTGAIMEKTGFDKKKVSNILHRLKQQGKIESASRGTYSKKG